MLLTTFHLHYDLVIPFKKSAKFPKNAAKSLQSLQNIQIHIELYSNLSFSNQAFKVE